MYIRILSKSIRHQIRQIVSQKEKQQIRCNYKGSLGTLKPISVCVDKASATETVDSSLIPDRVKPNALKLGAHGFPA